MKKNRDIGEEIKSGKNEEKVIVCGEKVIIVVGKSDSFLKKWVLKLVIMRYFKC